MAFRHDRQEDFNLIPLLNAVLQPVSADPATGLVEGRVIYRSDTDTFRIYLNGAWRTVFTDNAPPSATGTAGGVLTGTYPNPGLADGAVSNAQKIADSIITHTKVAAANKDGAAATPGMRSLGSNPGQAMSGDTAMNQLPPANGPVDFNGQQIVSIAAGTAASHAVNKAQLDAMSQGLDAKQSVRAYSETAGTVATATQLTGMPATVDGVALAVNDRVVLNDPMPGKRPANGIYVVATVGTGADGVWNRASDADSAGDLSGGTFVFVEEGTTKADSGWVISTNGAITIGTTDVVWVQFSGAGQIIDGNGLSKSGNTLSVNVDGTTIEIVGDALRIKDLGVTGAKIANTTIDLTTKVTGTLPVANGGTGVTTLPALKTALGVPGKYSTTSAAMTAGVWYTVTHNLGSRPVGVGIYDAATGEQVGLDVRLKAGALTTAIEIKTEITRAAAFYNIEIAG